MLKLSLPNASDFLQILQSYLDDKELRHKEAYGSVGELGKKEIAMTLSVRIKIARRHVGLSQQGLADKVGVTRGAVANWEGASKSIPASNHLAQIAVVSRVNHEWLSTGRGPMIVSHHEANTPCAGDCALDMEEQKVLRAFRLASPHVRKMMLEIAQLRTTRRSRS